LLATIANTYMRGKKYKNLVYPKAITNFNLNGTSIQIPQVKHQ